MSRDRTFADRIVGYLLPLGPVRARAMFGGFGIFHEDLMFALIADDRLYFKSDDESRPHFAAAGSEPFVYAGKTKPVEMSYWTAPAGTLDDPAALLPWATLGLAAARRARAVKSSKRPPKKRRKN